MRLALTRGAALAALALAAATISCAGDPSPTPRYVPLGGPDTPGTGRCPDAEDIGLVLAVWDEAEARTRYVLHQATLDLGTVGLPFIPEPVGDGALLVPITRQQADALGAPPDGAPVWVWAALGQGPCQMTPDQYLLVRDRDRPGVIALTREVTGVCTVPSTPGFAIAARTLTAPRACVLGWPSEVASSTRADGPPMGMPPEVATRLAGGRCPDPCDLRWRVMGVPTAFGGGAYEVTVAEVTPGPTGGPCDGRIDEDRWVVYSTRYGAGAVLPEAEELVGLLHDDVGVQTVVARGAGQLRVYATDREGRALSLRGTAPLWIGPLRPSLTPECPTTL